MELSVTEARKNLLKLADRIEEEPSTVVAIHRRGKRVMALISADLHDAVTETLEVLSDESTAARLRQALREIEKGHGMPWEAAKKRLGL
ncbi:MAG: type II toxin-antitoxin system Phd/YefM family antitoxin [Planctomycetes bacterium]|nr:type II toxin-antitoxin system Phd/YefM family antitoxin [Planctomycetota bacterium]